MKRLLSLLLVLCISVGLLPTLALAGSEGRLTITVPENVTVTLYTSYGASGSTKAYSTLTTENGSRIYEYSGLSSGSYSCKTSASGYYSLTKNIYYTYGTVVSMELTPGQKVGKGFESSVGVERTDEVLTNLLPSTKSTWAGYEHIFDTPTFTNEKGDHEFTSQEEMIIYLQNLLSVSDDVYYYEIGTSPSKGYAIPMVVFTTTDLSGKSMEEAAELLRANGKPTVLHQAQIHGNEPAAGEGSLALAGALARGDMKDADGENILQTVNVMVIPRINVDGSYTFTRANVADGMNMNRDYMRVQSAEVEAVLNAYNLFLPEVVIDAHEWTGDNTTESGVLDDLQLWAAGSLNNNPAILETEIDMMETVFEAAWAQNIRPYYYHGVVTFGAGGNSIGPYYYGLRGSMGFCVETCGIGIGKTTFERRVFSQYLASESFIQYVAANAGSIRAAVANERERIASVGATYDTDSVLVLKHGSKSYGKAYLRPTWNHSTGEAINENATATPTIYNVASKTRTRPTAYILSASTPNLEEVLATLDKHDITYYALEQEQTIAVKGYSGTSASASLSAETSVTFAAGSYVLPMNQAGGNILALLMEPDVGDTASSETYSTFAQNGILTVSSIYRYEGALDAIQNKPDTFTVIFAGSDGMALEVQEIEDGQPVSYQGDTPQKAYDESYHYSFTGWVDADGAPADLSCITADTTFYASFEEDTHSYSSKVSSKPTCTGAGAMRHTCTTCGRSYSEAISAVGHTTELQNVVEATCAAHGYSGDEVCTVCGVTVRMGTVTDLLPHSPVTVAGYEASCLNSGLTDGQNCSVCGTVIVAQDALPRLGHSYTYADHGETHTATCERCDKILTEAHSYVDGTCTCGAKEVTEPTVDANIVINHTLNLASDISIIYAVKTSLLTDYDSYYLECVLPTYEGNDLVGTTAVTVEPVLTGSYYYFTLTGVTAVQMNDVIEATLHMSKDGAEYVSNVDSYSVATYAFSQLNKTAATDKLKALCADLLRYGAAAQTYKGYRTDALVNAEMTEVHLAYLSDIDAVTFGNNNTTLSDIENPCITWAGKVLNLDSKVTLKFVLNTTNYTGSLENLSLHVSYNDYTGAAQTAVITEIEAYSAANNWYSFSFDDLLAAELRQVVSVAVYEGETQVSSALQYSADTYGNNKTGTLLDLCKALFAYSDTALAYFS